MAQEKVFSDLGRVSALKKKNPNLLIGVGGCVASQEGDNIVRRAPFVDMVFGPQTIHRLPHLIAERRRSGKAQVDVSFPEIEKFDNLPAPEINLLFLLETALAPLWVWLALGEKPPATTTTAGVFIIAVLLAHFIATLKATDKAK
jgi:hypothetical protein